MSVLEYPSFSGHPQSIVSHEQTTCPLQIMTQDLPHSSPLAFIVLATDMPVKPNAKTFLPLPNYVTFNFLSLRILNRVVQGIFHVSQGIPRYVETQGTDGLYEIIGK